MEKNKGINVQRFIIEIETYPDGKVFPKIMPAGKFMKRNTAKKTVKVQETKITDTEEW